MVDVLSLLEQLDNRVLLWTLLDVMLDVMLDGCSLAVGILCPDPPLVEHS